MTDVPVSQEAVEMAVTDADKEASAELAHTIGMSCEDFTSGGADVLVQAFARHRHQAERETLARMEPVYFVPTFQGHDFYRFPPQKTKPDKIHEGWSYVPLYALPPAPEAGQ